YWAQDHVDANKNVIVLGDFNTGQKFEFTSNDSEIGIMRGLMTSATEDDLEDLHKHLPAAEQATHLNGKQYDRILVSSATITDASGRKDLAWKSVRRLDEVAVRGEADDSHGDGYWEIPDAERDV